MNNLLGLVAKFEEARIRKQISESMLSKLAGMSKTAYFQIKNGTEPKVGTALNLCRVLDIPFRIGDEEFNPRREQREREKRLDRAKLERVKALTLELNKILEE